MATPPGKLARSNREQEVIEQLALWGSSPAFGRKLVVGQPNIGDRAYFLERVEQILDSRWFTNNGQCVQELEAALASYLGVKHCIAVCNATIGLEIAIRAMPMTGEVIVPFADVCRDAAFLAVAADQAGLLCIDPTTHLLDPGIVEGLINEKTSGILAVHLWGRPCAVEQLEAIAQCRGLHLLFDAAMHWDAGIAEE